jgi:hypothetical protein
MNTSRDVTQGNAIDRRADMNNCEIMGLESKTRNVLLSVKRRGTVGLTPCHTHGKLCGKGKHERTTYDPNGRKRAAKHSESSWMGHDQKTPVPPKIPVCQAASSGRNKRGLYHTGVTTRAADSGASDQQAQKIKPAHWLATIENSAVRLPLRFSRPSRDNPWYRLLIFSIALAKREVKVRQSMGVR